MAEVVSIEGVSHQHDGFGFAECAVCEEHFLATESAGDTPDHVLACDACRPIICPDCMEFRSECGHHA